MKTTDDLLRTISVMQRKPLCATTKLTLFTISKDEWNTKEDSLKNALDVLQYAKRHISQAEAMSNSEKIKLVVLAIIDLCLSEGISQAVSYLQ